jgi:4-hydroxybenzoyl-CoA thioesterase
MYERLIQIEFNHCDPAGIVFYPRYFEMVNSVIENFFADVVGRSYAGMIETGNAVPIVSVEASFERPSRLGDKVRFILRLDRVGGSSAQFRVEGHGPDGLRLRIGVAHVWIEGMKAKPWPPDMRAALEGYRETQDA